MHIGDVPIDIVYDDDTLFICNNNIICDVICVTCVTTQTAVCIFTLGRVKCFLSFLITHVLEDWQGYDREVDIDSTRHPASVPCYQLPSPYPHPPPPAPTPSFVLVPPLSQRPPASVVPAANFQMSASLVVRGPAVLDVLRNRRRRPVVHSGRSRRQVGGVSPDIAPNYGDACRHIVTVTQANGQMSEMCFFYSRRWSSEWSVPEPLALKSHETTTNFHFIFIRMNSISFHFIFPLIIQKIIIDSQATGQCRVKSN